MASLASTTTGHLAKYIAPTVAMVDESMKGSKRLKTTIKANNVLVKNNAANKKVLKDWQTLAASQGTEKQAKDLVLETDKGDVKFGQLTKPTVNINFGDMAEGMLAAAITARFVNKNRDITTDDVFDILKTFKKKTKGGSTPPGKKGLFGEVTFKSENANPKIIDDVVLIISLAEVNMNGLLDPKNKPSLMGLAKSAVAYANGTIVSANGKLIYENNIYNKINVVADGLGGQTTTKVDLYVEIGTKKKAPVRVNINLSLKAGSVKQFGQVGGIEYEKQVRLWKMLLNYESVVATIKDEYEQFLEDDSPVEAVSLAYNTVMNQLKTDLYSSRKKKKIMQSLADGITDFATSGEEGVTLVQLNKEDAKIYDFSDLQEQLNREEFDVRMEWQTGLGGRTPKMIIFKRSTLEGDADADDDLLQIRVKTEKAGTYFRNYVEKGRHLGNLISSYAGQPGETP